jgi:ABC-type multidrug transport system ATPase subunit
VLGHDPLRERDALMRDVCFIADTAVLPRWLRVRCAIDYVAGVHPRFDRARAGAFPQATTASDDSSRIGELSKGMVTQLHLALILAIDAQLLVLDEPTLGLDLLYRRQFYDTLLNDYFDKQRTILLTTHQVEEVENLLTDVLFIDRGRWCSTRPPRIWRHASSSSSSRPTRSTRRAPSSLSMCASCSAAPSCCTRTGQRQAWPHSAICLPPVSPTCSWPRCRGARHETWPIQIQREFWEHRGLWIAPLVIA